MFDFDCSLFDPCHTRLVYMFNVRAGGAMNQFSICYNKNKQTGCGETPCGVRAWVKHMNPLGLHCDRLSHRDVQSEITKDATLNLSALHLDLHAAMHPWKRIRNPKPIVWLIAITASWLWPMLWPATRWVWQPNVSWAQS